MFRANRCSSSGG